MKKQQPLLLNTNLVPTGSRVAVAVSGGADSTALLFAFHEQRAALGIGLSAIHLHHGIRGEEADADRDFLIALCATLDVPLHVTQTDIPALVQKNRETEEEAARNARLALFRSHLAAGHADLVATAHTQDDQAETVLLKLIRGAWLDGLAAIHPRVELVPGALIRPILHLRRADVEAFLRSRNQPWRDDSTNAQLHYTRNRVRHTLMPLLREFNPQITATLAATADLAREEAEQAARETERLLPQVLLPGKPVRGGGRAVGAPGESVSIEIERLRTLSLSTRRRILRAATRSLGVRLSAADTLKLLRLGNLQPPTAPPDPTVSAKPGAKLTLKASTLNDLLAKSASPKL